MTVAIMCLEVSAAKHRFFLELTLSWWLALNYPMINLVELLVLKALSFHRVHPVKFIK